MFKSCSPYGLTNSEFFILNVIFRVCLKLSFFLMVRVQNANHYTIAQWSLSVLSNPQKYQCDSMGLHEFFHHSAIVSCITFHVWKSVDFYFSNKVYRDISRNSYVLTKTLKCLCTLYLKKTQSTDFHKWKVMHEIIAEWWKNTCRPLESLWYVLRVESPLWYMYKSTKKVLLLIRRTK